MKPTRVSILIPTHNRRELLAQTLESLSRVRPVEGVAVEIVVVANGCTDGTADLVRRMSEGTGYELRVAEEDELGLNVARNRAVKEATGEVLALLDDDVFVESDWLAGVVEGFEAGADLVGGRTRLWWKDVDRPAWMSREVESMLSRADHGEQMCELDRPGQVVGANFAFRRVVYEKIGGFKVGLDRAGSGLLAGGEHEFIARALAGKCRMVYAPKASVQHYVAPKRIEMEYLDAVSYGRGLSKALMLEKLGVGRSARILVSRGWQWMAHGVGEVMAGMVLNRQSRMRHRVMRRMAGGTVAGVMGRMLGGRGRE